jgi:hypothetical protein
MKLYCLWFTSFSGIAKKTSIKRLFMNLRVLNRYHFLTYILMMLILFGIAFTSFVLGALVQKKWHIVEKYL